MLGADKPSDEMVEKFCYVHEWVLPSPDGLSEVRPRGPLSYLECKQSILTGWAQKRQETR
jgi:hypothetical protein